MPSERRRGACAAALVTAMLLAEALAGPPVMATEPPIEAIEFVSDAPIDAEGLRQLLPMREGEPLRADALAEGERRLRLTELFSDVSIDARQGEGGVVLAVRLHRRPVLNRVRFSGNGEIGNEALERAARLRPGTLLTEAMVGQAIAQVQRLYADSGFPQAQVRARRERRRRGEVDIVVAIEEGPPLLVENVEIEGNLPVPRDEIAAHVDVKAGDRFVRAQLRESQRAVLGHLRSLGFYETDVDGEWVGTRSGYGILRLLIEPGPPFDVVFVGNEHFSEKKLLRQVDLARRPIITDGTWREVARRARQAYVDDGFCFARVDVRIEESVPKKVEFTVFEGERYRIDSVEFRGNQFFSDAQLRRAMETRPPRWVPWHQGFVDDDVLQADVDRLRAQYAREGFLAAAVRAEPVFDEERGRARIEVSIEEGPRTMVGAVHRYGFDGALDDDPGLGLQVGGPWSEEQVERDRRLLLGALADRGYARASVTAETRVEDGGPLRQATVTFSAVPGAPQRVGTIVVQNNVDTRTRVIRRELPFESGDVLRPTRLLDGQRKIHRLGLFRSVSVRPADVPEGAAVTDAEEETGPAPEEAQATETDVLVNVSEKPAGSLQWGVGYNTRDGFRGFLEIGHANLHGLARRLSLRGEFNLEPGDVVPNEYLGNLSFREPRLGNTAWRLRANVIGQRATRSVDQFSIERVALIPAIERDLEDRLYSGVELIVEEADVFDLEPDVLEFNPRDDGNLTTVSLGPFLVYDTRDDPFLPRRGLFDSLRLRVAPGFLGSDVPFTKIQAEHRQYIPVLEDFTFMYLARLGWARPFRGGDILPIRERFFLGGRTTVRGFEENSIGPQGDLGNPLGGDLALNVNAEFWIPLFYGLGSVLFVDGGGVYLQEESIAIDDFRRSAGLGLRYVTPVGPIGLDYGFKLDRRLGESVGEIHFSVGAAF